MTTIEDSHRFRRSQDVGAYLGLTPRRYRRARLTLAATSRSARSPNSQAAVRSGQRHAVADLAGVRAEGLGRGARSKTGLLEGARCAGPQAGGDPLPDMDRRAWVVSVNVV
ncbi:hypothetical protein [Sphingomonas melonis]